MPPNTAPNSMHVMDEVINHDKNVLLDITELNLRRGMGCHKLNNSNDKLWLQLVTADNASLHCRLIYMNYLNQGNTRVTTYNGKY